MKFIIPFILSCVLILFFQSCGTPLDPKVPTRRIITITDPTFHSYIQEFEHYYGKSVSEIPIGFADLDPKFAGTCTRSIMAGTANNSYIAISYISIDRTYWYKLSDYQRINLIFHELGHCALNKKHVPSDSVGVCPTSFMFERVLSTTCIRDNYDAYIEELFR